MAFTQTPKEVVNVGEIGNASTGDILYDGGVKINKNFSDIFNAFGDQRLFAAADGENTQIIHATGYYQKLSFNDYRDAIHLGTCHDISTNGQKLNVRIAKGNVGEAIYFVNSDGSISEQTSLTIQTTDGDGFASGGDKIEIVSPFTRVEVWCVSKDQTGKAVWDYSITSMFGQQHVPLERTFTINQTGTDIVIAGLREFNSIKLLMSYVATPPGKNIRQSSETLLLIDSSMNQVYSTEYAVIRMGGEKGDDEFFYNATYSVNSAGKVVLTVKSNYANARLAIKSIGTQTVGTGI